MKYRKSCIFSLYNHRHRKHCHNYIFCVLGENSTQKDAYKKHTILLPAGTGDGACVGAGGIDEDGTGGIVEGEGEYSEGVGGNSDGDGGYIEGEGGMDDGDGDSLHSTGSVPEAKQYCLFGSSNLHK